jgi:hypothetical protein
MGVYGDYSSTFAHDRIVVPPVLPSMPSREEKLDVKIDNSFERPYKELRSFGNVTLR